MEQKDGYHVGLILDGNGRWATQQNKPRLFGHAEGANTMLRLIDNAAQAQVHTLTLYAFAIANWKRDAEEVDGLWALFMEFLEAHLETLLQQGARFKSVGDRTGLPAHVRTAAEDAEERSKDNTGLLLQIALNYDGVDEVVRMMRAAVESGITPEEVTSEYILSHLDTEAENDLDILVRTGMKESEGKFSYWRSSSFLPLQSVQSVCVGTQTLWPDFEVEELKEIIAFADPNDRLFGGQR
tara:strand:+ start:347 stop:1066 length:720 start_codon:yes stop_codon:yes gene_type:complete